MGISNIGIDIVDIDRFRKKEYGKNKIFYFHYILFFEIYQYPLYLFQYLKFP